MAETVRFRGDTIAAVSTPPGAGGRGIVRLSGPDALAVADRVFDPAPGEPSWPEAPGFAIVRGHVRWSSGGPPAPARALVERAPRSYTREDIVEFHLPGSPPILAGALRRALASGARPAGPGEFTRRALESGRIDLAQAEAVERLIRAASAAELAAARRALSGELGRAVGRVAEALRGLLVDVEAGLDFAEEEGVSGPDPAEVRRRLDPCRWELERLGRLPPEGEREPAATIALAGRPNAGKSTLFNRLLGRERAIVSPERGTTRDPVRASVSWQGRDVELVDLAGEGDPRDEIEREAGRRARVERGRAAAVLWLVPVDAEDPGWAVGEALDAAREVPGALRILWSKADLGLPPAVEVPGGAFVASGRSGEGIPGVLRWVERRVLAEVPAGAGLSAATAREAEALLEAARALARARGARDEVLALEVREALERLEAVAGPTPPEAILDRIFARFCAGK